MDFGYLGQHTIPVEHIASQQSLDMGVRTYLPVLGRFLQTDPVSGGSANNYDYVNADPVNDVDLTGKNDNFMCECGGGGGFGPEFEIGAALAAEAGAGSGVAAAGRGAEAEGGGTSKRGAGAEEGPTEPAPAKSEPANSPAAGAKVNASPEDMAKGIGAGAREVGKGSGQGQYIATEVTKLGLGQMDAAKMANEASKEAFGETSGIMKDQNGDMVILPTQLQVGAWLEVSPTGEVTAQKGSIGTSDSDALNLLNLTPVQ